MSKIEYKDLLYQISEKLDESELPRLIFMCSEEIPESSVENIRDVLAFFKELEKHNHLGIDLLDILKEILKQMKKRSLLKKVEEFETRRKAQSVGIVPSLKRLATCIIGAVKLVCNFRTIARGVLVVGSGMALRSYSSLDEFKEFFDKLVLVYSKLVEISEGSLCFTVQAETSSALKELWDKYKSGTLQNRLQEFLVTDEIKQLASGEDVEVTVYIDEQEYKAAYLDLVLLQKQDSDVTEEERLGGRRRRNSDSFLCFKRNDDDVTLLELNWERQRRQFLEEIKKLREEIAMAECMQRRLVSQMEESAQGTEDLVRPRNRRRRNSDSSLYCKARDETTAQSEGGAETRHLDSDKYEFVQSYLQNIQETHSITTETTDSGIRTHFDPSDLEMQDISVMSYPQTARRGNRSRSVIVVEVRIPIPKDKVGLIIGRKGGTVQEIRDRTGVQISITKKHAHLTGTLEQCNNATEIIEEILKGNMPIVNSKSLHASPGQLVKIPDQFKKHVRGPGGDNLRNVSTLTGAKVTQLGDQELYVRGEKKKVQHAEFLLRTRVAAARVRPNKICVFIDERYLPHECELKLVPVKERERMILPGAQSQYRLKPFDEYKSQGACALNDTVSDYDASLTKSVLSSLRYLKLQSDLTCGADMWSHFGKVIIRDPDEVDVHETWSITQSLNKLQATPQRRNEWLIAFNEGVDLEDKVVHDTFGEQNEEDFIARYDFSFLTPSHQLMRCKVWVANKDIKKKLEEIPIPFRDLKNIVEEVRFEDEPTRQRCRGWLVLQSKKFLHANIIFPGSDIDCRLSIRAHSDNAIDDKSGVHEKEATTLLSQYVSKLTFTDDYGLRLPDETFPQGFLCNHWRCSRRTLYTPRPGFTMIVSKERSWNSDVREEGSRETTDIHLHCEKWDQALSEEDWEPEVIVAELPEFLQFMRQVQEFVSSHCHRRAEK